MDGKSNQKHCNSTTSAFMEDESESGVARRLTILSACNLMEEDDEKAARKAELKKTNSDVTAPNKAIGSTANDLEERIMSSAETRGQARPEGIPPNQNDFISNELDETAAHRMVVLSACDLVDEDDYEKAMVKTDMRNFTHSTVVSGADDVEKNERALGRDPLGDCTTDKPSWPCGQRQPSALWGNSY